eukprot:gene9530-19817_t
MGNSWLHTRSLGWVMIFSIFLFLLGSSNGWQSKSLFRISITRSDLLASKSPTINIWDEAVHIPKLQVSGIEEKPKDVSAVFMVGKDPLPLTTELKGFLFETFQSFWSPLQDITNDLLSKTVQSFDGIMTRESEKLLNRPNTFIPSTSTQNSSTNLELSRLNSQILLSTLSDLKASPNNDISKIQSKSPTSLLSTESNNSQIIRNLNSQNDKNNYTNKILLPQTKNSQFQSSKNPNSNNNNNQFISPHEHEENLSIPKRIISNIGRLLRRRLLNIFSNNPKKWVNAINDGAISSGISIYMPSSRWLQRSTDQRITNYNTNILKRMVSFIRRNPIKRLFLSNDRQTNNNEEDDDESESELSVLRRDRDSTNRIINNSIQYDKSIARQLKFNRNRNSNSNSNNNQYGQEDTNQQQLMGHVYTAFGHIGSSMFSVAAAIGFGFQQIVDNYVIFNMSSISSLLSSLPSTEQDTDSFLIKQQQRITDNNIPSSTMDNRNRNNRIVPAKLEGGSSSKGNGDISDGDHTPSSSSPFREGWDAVKAMTSLLVNDVVWELKTTEIPFFEPFTRLLHLSSSSSSHNKRQQQQQETETESQSSSTIGNSDVEESISNLMINNDDDNAMDHESSIVSTSFMSSSAKNSNAILSMIMPISVFFLPRHNNANMKRAQDKGSPSHSDSNVVIFVLKSVLRTMPLVRLLPIVQDNTYSTPASILDDRITSSSSRGDITSHTSDADSDNSNPFQLDYSPPRLSNKIQLKDFVDMSNTNTGTGTTTTVRDNRPVPMTLSVPAHGSSVPVDFYEQQADDIPSIDRILQQQQQQQQQQQLAEALASERSEKKTTMSLDDSFAVRLGRSAELRVRPAFLAKERIPLPTKADFGLIKYRISVVAIEAALNVVSESDAQEFLKDIGLKPLIDAISATSADLILRRVDIIKGICRIIRKERSIAAIAAADKNVVALLCDLIEAPLRGLKRFQPPAERERELKGQREAVALVQRMVRSSEKAVESLRSDVRLKKALYQTSLMTLDNELVTPRSSSPLVMTPAPSSKDKKKVDKRKVLGEPVIVDFPKLATSEMARVAAWGLGGIPWKPKVPGQRGLRILSFDGGGTRGVLSVSMLKELLVRVGNPHAFELFDIICGTSTGGIIVENLYDNLIDKIFGKGSNIKLVSEQAFYDENDWEQILSSLCGDELLIDSNQKEEVPRTFCISTRMN